MRVLGIVFMLFLISACAEKPQVAVPSPQVLTREAVGYYCNMIVLTHRGPKGQIFLAGQSEPLWFTSVRDTLTFTMLPEEPKDIAAVYVNDMGIADWDNPEPDTWIDANTAWYVLGSNKVGGMGVPEVVPFSQRPAAQEFAARHGGNVMRLDQISQEEILSVPMSDLQPATE